MAEFQNPQEIAEEMTRLKEQFEAGYLSVKEFNERMKDAEIGVRGYTANLKASMDKLGTSLKGLGADMYKGTKGVGQFGGSIESGADAVAAYTKKFGPAGMAVGLFTQAVAKFASASLKMSDQLFESYQKISRAGVVGSGAMSEVYDNLRNFGYTIDELGNLGDLLTRNSKSFGMFFQSALQGSRAFGQVASQIQNSPLREQFFRLGMSVDDINDGIAGYINQQGKLGRAQGQTTEQLAKGAEAYVKELDLLTKLTGMTRQEQEDAREQALQIEQFYAGLMDLDPDAAEQALQAFTIGLARGGPKFAAQMAAQFNGAIDQSQDLVLSTQGRSIEAFSKEFFQRGGKGIDSINMMAEGISQNMVDATKEVNKFGAQIGFNARTLVTFKTGNDRIAESMKNLTQEQQDQLAGLDKTTASQAKTRDSQIKTAQNLQDFTRMGVAPATKALQIFTEAIEYLTGFIPGFESKEKKAARAAAVTATSRGAGGTDAGGTMGGTEVPTAGPAELGPTPAAPGAPQVGGGGPPAIAPEDYIKFTSGTGDRAHFDQLQPAVREKFLAMAQAYNALTGGKKLQVNSAFRSPEEQAAVDPGTNPKAAPGMSLHQLGRALDIQSDQRQHLEAAGLLSQYGFKPLAGDPPHISAALGAVLSGPMSGYQPNLTMHGTEAIVPLNTPAQQAAAGMGDTSVMSAQLEKLDEMVSILKSQLGVQTKLM